MTTLSPEAYADDYRDATYMELLLKRDELIRNLKEYEEKTGNTKGVWPENTLYLARLGYLSAICKLVADKYRDIQWNR